MIFAHCFCDSLLVSTSQSGFADCSPELWSVRQIRDVLSWIRGIGQLHFPQTGENTSGLWACYYHVSMAGRVGFHHGISWHVPSCLKWLPAGCLPVLVGRDWSHFLSAELQTQLKICPLDAVFGILQTELFDFTEPGDLLTFWSRDSFVLLEIIEDPKELLLTELHLLILHGGIKSIYFI